MYVCMYALLCVYMYVCMNVRMSSCIYVCLYEHMKACMYVYVCKRMNRIDLQNGKDSKKLKELLAKKADLQAKIDTLYAEYEELLVLVQ